MGTWCGDSQEWVPRLVKLWDELGLDREQLKFTALYGSGDNYKQGPNGEEKGLNIHRVPTFIFKQDGKEYARIVESPSTDLLTDVAQIALGYPSAPNYAGATYILSLFDEKSMEEIYKDMNNVWRTLYYKVGRYAELNTLGNVLYAADQRDQALFVFNLNTAYYPGNWRVQQRFAELLAEMEDYENAIIFYEKVVQLNPENEEAKSELERIKQLQAEKEETKKDAD
jgi:tetratricopeptide (TPR) repeat protein